MSVKTASRALESPPVTRRWALTTTAAARASRCSAAWRRRSSCACSMIRTRRRAWSLEQGDGFVWQGYLPAAQPGPALRLSRARAVGPGCGRSL